MFDKITHLSRAFDFAGRWVFGLLGVVVLALTPANAQQEFATIKGGPNNPAWWVSAEFHPFTTEVRGVPANQIHKNWCKATEFRSDLIPREWRLDQKGVDAMQAAGMSFALEGRFDGLATKQVALVGVYQECTGKTGSFTLILDQPADGKPKVRFLNAVQTDHQFGALQRGKDNTIVVWSCMECDGMDVLRWDRKKRKFDWLPQPGE